MTCLATSPPLDKEVKVVVASSLPRVEVVDTAGPAVVDAAIAGLMASYTCIELPAPAKEVEVPNGAPDDTPSPPVLGLRAGPSTVVGTGRAALLVPIPPRPVLAVVPALLVGEADGHVNGAQTSNVVFTATIEVGRPEVTTKTRVAPEKTTPVIDLFTSGPKVARVAVGRAVVVPLAPA